VTDSRVRLSVTWIAQPGSEDRVKGILGRLARATAAEPGCLRYSVFQGIDDPRRFVLYEEYRDAVAVREHSESPHFKRLVLGEAFPLLESRERVEVGLLADSRAATNEK
jgi:quinol monooxygenase YgiN